MELELAGNRWRRSWQIAVSSFTSSTSLMTYASTSTLKDLIVSRLAGKLPGPIPEFNRYFKVKQVSFDGLPKEIQLEVMKNLSLTELLKYSQVCRYWFQLTLDGSLWTDIDISPYYNLISSKQLVKILSSSGNFAQNLNLRGFPSLTTDIATAITLNCHNLRSVNFSGCRRLTSFQLIQIFQTTPHLQQVNLSGLFSATSSVVECLAQNNRNLTRVNVAWCKHISNDSLCKLVSSCRKLSHIKFSGSTVIQRNTLLNISTLSQLSHLALDRCQNLIDKDILALSEGKLSKLTHLDLTNLQISELSLLPLITLRPPLEWLDISGCVLLPESAILTLIDQLTSLSYFGAESCSQVTDRTLRRLTSLPDLKRLSLGGCEGITDPGVFALLKGCPKLVTLELENCPHITDAVLRSLTTWIPNHLTTLDVFDCRNLSHDALQDLSKQCPNLKTRSFYRNFDTPQPYHRHLFEGFDSDSSPNCLIL